MKRSFTLFNLCLGMMLSVSVCAIDLPDFGDSSGAVITPAQERLIGEMVYRQARARTRVIDDPELADYLNELASKLTDHSEGYLGEWTFFLIEDPSINAFAAPGGFIGVHTGLLLNARNESEVAAVLAHEVAHVTQRHMARSYEQASQFSLPMMAAMIGAILVATQSPDAGMAGIAAVQAGATQNAINFTRSNEREADAIGMQLLYRAGFNPNSMPAFFQQLHNANRYSSGNGVPEFLRTHPVTSNRIADSLSRAEQLPPREYLQTSRSFFLTQARLQAHTLEAKPGQSLRYFSERLRRQSVADPLADRYGYVEALMLNADYEQALVQSTLLRKADPDEPAFLLQAARVAVKAGKIGQGLELFQSAVSRYPLNRAANLGLIETLLLNNENDQAHQRLRDYTYTFKADYTYHKLMAESYSRQGQPIEAHMALAEQYYALGALELAIAQLRLAGEIADSSFYQRERIKSRLATIEKELTTIQEMQL